MTMLHAPAEPALGDDCHVELPGSASLAYVSMGSGGMALLVPNSYGTTLAGLEHTTGQRHFLHALAGGNQLICFDQRGFGASTSAVGSTSWDERAADLWAVADAAGVERAVLYGVYDAGHTIAHAALMAPERVLGLVFNAAPLHFSAAPGDSSGVPSSDLDITFRPGSGPAYGRPFQTNVIGLGSGDTEALALAWDAALPSHEAVVRHESLLREADLRPLLPRLQVRALAVGPRRRQHLVTWAQALAQLLPNGRAVCPESGNEAIGAVQAYLSLLSAEVGHQASRLPAELSATMSDTRRAVRSLLRIVVPVESNADSGRAVELACRLGEAQRAEIVLVHVIVVPHTLPLDHPLPEAERRGRRALQFGEAIVAEHGLMARCRLLHERSAAGAVARLATDERADLIVVELGRPRADGATPVGETVQELLRRAPCEVLVDRGASS